jgi:hypothetical protein
MGTENYVLAIVVSGSAILMMFLIQNYKHARASAKEQRLLADKQEAIFASMLRSVAEKNSEPSNAGPSSGGYIIVDLPDAQKPLFHDLLKGFEDYARLRGYVVSFSADNSFPGKFAFKFTLQGYGINVSPQQVERDLQEYIRRVRDGESLDDLPVVISPQEHALVLTEMKNRISMLEHSRNLQKNTISYYEKLIEQMPRGGFQQPPQAFYFLNGENAANYHALNSPQAALGTGNKVISNTIDSSIYLADSFNERKEQVDAVQDLYWKLWNELEAVEKQDDKAEERKALEKARNLIGKVEAELKEEEKPDPERIHKWLENAKNCLKALSLTEQVRDSAAHVWEAFKMLAS